MYGYGEGSECFGASALPSFFRDPHSSFSQYSMKKRILILTAGSRGDSLLPITFYPELTLRQMFRPIFANYPRVYREVFVGKC